MHAEPSVPRAAQARLARTLVPPLALALPPLFWVAEATRRASLTTLGRDQGIFQYVAWALRRGVVGYRDLRDVNGPLTYLVHMVMLALGGADEHRFRVLDLVVTGVTFALVGACMPGLRSSRAPEALERAAWALAGWVVLSGQYLLYGYWDLAQRESFFDWFLLPSIGLQVVAQAHWRGHSSPRRQTRWLVLCGALSVIPWFGKPTYAIFTVTQVAALLCDDELVLTRERAVGAFAIGGAIGACTQLAFLFAWCDPRAFVHIQFVDVPAMYRFIWPRAAVDILSEPWRASQAIYAVVGGVVLGALVLLGEMPRRTLTIALAPLAALASVLVQAKGFPYHFHPVTATVHLQWLTFAAFVTERSRVAQRRRAALRTIPIAVGAVVGLRVATAILDSSYLKANWLVWGARTPEERTTSEYFSHFPEPDFFPFELRQAAAYLQTHTQADDRVQTYGMDPYLLFLARRLSATPYIYAYDLNVDAALYGGTGGHPSSAQASHIRAMHDINEADLLDRLEANPPAAFVFVDSAPLLSKADAWDDFQRHCPRAATWLRPRYREAARFGHDHIWLRLDRAAAAAAEDAPSDLPSEDEAPDDDKSDEPGGKPPGTP